MNDLKDKVVVVTGGNSRMGRAMVLGFAARGARVAVGDRAAEPEPCSDATIMYRQCDVSKRQDEAIDAVLGVNLKGTLYDMKYGLQAMVG